MLLIDTHRQGNAAVHLRLAELNPTTLAVIRGSCFNGDATTALLAVVDNYNARHNETSRWPTPPPATCGQLDHLSAAVRAREAHLVARRSDG
jgi:hypothetical protein